MRKIAPAGLTASVGADDPNKRRQIKVLSDRRHIDERSLQASAIRKLIAESNSFIAGELASKRFELHHPRISGSFHHFNLALRTGLDTFLLAATNADAFQ